jgi:bis(5'-nucleosyl)-tetraphosphatase (symmetrical)
VATYIVGDIQGCYSGLRKLLKKAKFDSNKDKLWAVGDLVGRGPEALETLQYLNSLGKSFDTVLGNHDLHLLAIYCGFRTAKPGDRLDVLLGSEQLKTYVKWLRQKPLAAMVNKHTIITHAGLYPLWSFEKALSLSSEVSEQLTGKNWQDLLAAMYNNEPSIWSKNLEDIPRWRFIINAFTRMRYIKEGAHLDFDCKTAPGCAPEAFSPWFKVENSKLSKKQQVVFGHWAALEGKTESKRFIGLDTGFVWGQSMTLLNLDSGNKIIHNNQGS